MYRRVLLRRSRKKNEHKPCPSGENSAKTHSKSQRYMDIYNKRIHGVASGVSCPWSHFCQCACNTRYLLSTPVETSYPDDMIHHLATPCKLLCPRAPDSTRKLKNPDAGVTMYPIPVIWTDRLMPVMPPIPAPDGGRRRLMPTQQGWAQP